MGICTRTPEFQVCILAPTPTPTAKGSCLGARGPGTEVCLTNAACLADDTYVDVFHLGLPLALAGAGNRVNNLGEGGERKQSE